MGSKFSSGGEFGGKHPKEGPQPEQRSAVVNMHSV